LVGIKFQETKKILIKLCVLLLLLPCLAQAQSADVLNPDVNQDSIQKTICVPGYTKTVRPSVNYTNGVKRKLLRDQRMDESQIGEFELDHKLPLTLGGHPRNIHNLTLQLWSGRDGAKEKDKLEIRLSKLVCRNKISLIDAQICIWNDWRNCALKYKK
jgi:hypothetical protein